MDRAGSKFKETHLPLPPNVEIKSLFSYHLISYIILRLNYEGNSYILGYFTKYEMLLSHRLKIMGPNSHVMEFTKIVSRPLLFVN